MDSTQKKIILFVHFGEQQLRGSERCLINIISHLETLTHTAILWTNHKLLSDLSNQYLDNVIYEDFTPSFGFGYHTHDKQKLNNLSKLINNGIDIIKREGIDLIVCNSLAPCQWMAPASIFTSTPLISYIHSAYLPKLRFFSLSFASNHLFGVSEFTLNNFWNDNYPKNQTSIIYNGVDDLALTPVIGNGIREELGIPLNNFVVTSISALIDIKKIDVIIESFRILCSANTRNKTLIIVGEGPERLKLESLAAGLPVIFVGWRDDIANILRGSDCLAIASEREAFGLTVIEAASLACPVIGPNSGGVSEIIENNHTGLLFQPGNSVSLAKLLIDFFENPELRKKLGKNARHSYEMKFTVERMSSSFNKLIDEIIASHKQHFLCRIIRVLRLLNLSTKLIFRRIIGRT